MRLLVALLAEFQMKIYQMDTAYLNGDLEKQVFIDIRDSLSLFQNWNRAQKWDPSKKYHFLEKILITVEGPCMCTTKNALWTSSVHG